MSRRNNMPVCEKNRPLPCPGNMGLNPVEWLGGWPKTPAEVTRTTAGNTAVVPRYEPLAKWGLCDADELFTPTHTSTQLLAPS